MAKPVRLFISSVPEDAALRAELEAHLKPLARQRLIEVWHEGKVDPGGQPAAQVHAHLEATEIVVLLVTPAFIASDRHMHEEAAQALARRTAGEVDVVPVLVRDCAWDWTEFGKLAPLPKEGPIGGAPDRDRAWTEVARGLRRVVDGVIARRAAAGGQRSLAAGLPPEERCIGRGAVVDSLAAALSREPPGRALLLGAAGIGKSTVSLAVLHRPEILARFGERRFFVRLDTAPDAASAAASLADTLRVAPGPNLQQRALSFLAAGPAVIALDNLETPWNGDDQAGTEALLAELAAIPQLALVASVRGAGRPGRVAWNSPVELWPVGPAEAEAMFCAIAGEEHRGKPALSALLALQEGVPLAIELLAHAAQGNDLVNLKEEWEARRTAVLERQGGARDRLRSWNASLELSIMSRQMTAGARRLLAVLAVLPDGIAQRDLAAVLPDAGPAAARVLAHVRLAYFEGGRLKMLSPVRAYVKAAHPPVPEDLGQAMAHYGELARQFGPVPGRRGGTEAAARLTPETANLDAVIRRGLDGGEALRWIDIAMALTEFARFSGHAAPLPLGRALEAARRAGDTRRESLCAQGLGDIALERSQHDEAKAHYQQALPLYRQVGHVRGEADCIKRFGDIALERSQHDEARARYQEALPLYQKEGDALGEANCIGRLGDIALRRSQHDEARERYQRALPLYRQVGDVRGEANCIMSLGDIALRRSQHDEAKACYQQALPLYQQVGAVRGEANCILRSGDIALGRSQHDEARERYQRALPLYQRVGDVLGEANCIKSLGDIALRCSQHDEARERYQRALPLYRQVGDVLGEANCIAGLGDIALRRSQHDEARERYQRALPLYRQVGDVLGEANCIAGLGEIALTRSQHDDARELYQEVLPLYRQVGDVRGEANCIAGLGDIALRRSQHDEATTLYREALPLYRQAGSVLGKANCIKSLGDVALARSQHDDARELYQEALPLYRQAGNVLGEANCIYCVGDIALRRSQHDDARERFQVALPLYRQVGDVLGEANCIAGLGEIALGRSPHDEARELYQEALPLYRQVGDVRGEANCSLRLGDIARAHCDASAANARYEEALALYRRIPEPLSIGWTHRRLAVIASDSAARRRHLEAARSAWQSIDRVDLISRLDQDFPS
ncbi:toll/interleukin-1 receptor domain-containing protein [Sorangium sp. So ce726]|uniref:tetratricopeptide repeat protein n=1 Tax=Sorangium sp. So ce726 TaxID=3133319 RepID=UPI003F63081F